MKTLPPELIDGIIALLSAAVGWFGRWLQTRRKTDTLEKRNAALERYIDKKINPGGGQITR